MSPSRTNTPRAGGAHGGPAAAPDYESEVRRNILSQPLGDGTVADLDLSHDFLRRLVDRALRVSFYERFRGVLSGAPSAEPENAGTMGETSARGAESPARAGPSSAVTAVPAERTRAWESLPEATPELASFRSPSVDPAALARRRLVGRDDAHAADASSITARRLVRKHLAGSGLLPTLVHAIAALGPDTFAHEESSASSGERLADLGVPVDLLAFFPTDDSGGGEPGVVRSIATRLAAGEPVERLVKSLRRARMEPRASLAGFRPTSESGTDTIGLVRMHATRGAYFAAPGDGGALDLVSGLLRALPGARALISVLESDSRGVMEALERETGARAASPIGFLSQPIALAQWSGDTVKGGTTVDVSGSVPAQLVPRFASRREYAARFLPGDDLAVACSEFAGLRTARSPLQFQGGNLLVCDDLASSQRVLLIGEAEIERNHGLGLSREQAAEFLRVEFGADSCHVLPAASYHIDQEITVRSALSGGRRTLAFVPDVAPAARLIADAALGALGAAGRWPAALTDDAREGLRAGRVRESALAIWARLDEDRAGASGWPLPLAETLSIGPADSGVGNFHRFLLALDHLGAEALRPSEIADPNFAALLRSYQRRAEDRARVRTILSRLGWRIIPVPAIPEDARGINPLNGIHTPESYLMPAYGGLYGALDLAAAEVFRAAVGGAVSVIPVPTGESQRREGALHCSAALYSSAARI